VTKRFFLLLFFIGSLTSFSQTKDSLNFITVDSVAVKLANKKLAKIKKREARQKKNFRAYDALAPSKAAFYSAIVPGLGQVYNKQYWKLPIVYGGLGTGIGIAIWNDNKYNELRDIYKNRLLGIYTDKFYDQDTETILVSNDALINAMEGYQKQKEMSILISIGIYVLNIVDANVTAHLQQYNINDDLSLTPQINIEDPYFGPTYGLNLSYQF